MPLILSVAPLQNSSKKNHAIILGTGVNNHGSIIVAHFIRIFG